LSCFRIAFQGTMWGKPLKRLAHLRCGLSYVLANGHSAFGLSPYHPHSDHTVTGEDFGLMIVWRQTNTNVIRCLLNS
ncbi:MAG: hypothetical protein VX698_01645, partial [Pseudomonadota bacterium]|nr:hypothetical protein [Pseudomonadota bacterium]